VFIPSHRPHVRLLLATLLLSASAGCSPGAASPATTSPPVAPEVLEDAATSARPGEFVLVLAAFERLDAAEQARLRIAAGRALTGAVEDGRPTRIVQVAEPEALDDVVETAAREAAIVCVLGARARDALAAALLSYPQTVGCVLPDDGDGDGEGAPLLTADVDLTALGLELGRTARAAAGQGTVILLWGQDAMLDARWIRGLQAGADGGPKQTVMSAQELEAALDEATSTAVSASTLARSDRPVVVLDASRLSGELVGPLLARGVAVVAPRSILSAVPPQDLEAVVLRWRIRWDIPLLPLLREALLSAATGSARAVLSDGGDATTAVAAPRENAVILEPGPAYVAPAARLGPAPDGRDGELTTSTR
jgi:hypothetical protein